MIRVPLVASNAFRRAFGTKTPVLISVADAAASKDQFVFVDGSFHVGGRNSQTEYLNEHIPNARYFDINSVCDKTNSLPHMVPSTDTWIESMNKFGMNRNDHVVVYTHGGAASGPRVWYLFRTFGHENVSILNGGIEGWKAAGNKIANSEEIPSFNQVEGGYQGAIFNSKMVADKEDVKIAMETGISQICDARSAARFKGEINEPRAGLVSGSIPGSLNLPYTELCVDGDTTTFLEPKEIRDKLLDAGMIFGSKCISTCGSGVTACYAVAAMEMMGKPLEDIPVYDGSWTEWGDEANDLPKMTNADFKK
jgi:thiosulfate/3-mercaptopyruvate sulfurtransferase